MPARPSHGVFCTHNNDHKATHLREPFQRKLIFCLKPSITALIKTKNYQAVSICYPQYRQHWAPFWAQWYDVQNAFKWLLYVTAAKAKTKNTF
jgi:hypothetical protein